MQKTEKIKIGELLKTELRPLTRRQTSSEVLTRLPEIESAILETLELDWNDFSVRLKISDTEDARIVKEEVLVFYLRAAIACGNEEAIEELSQIIWDRVEKRIESYARKLVPTNYFEEAISDMLGDLFMKLCDLNSNTSDFAQVRFWLYLKRLCGERWSRYQTQGKFDSLSLSLDQISEATEKKLEIEAEIETYATMDWQDIKKGLNVLHEPIRTAFILRYGKGLQIESNNPNEWTISKHFGKTERTIRNWLTQSKQLLDAWRKEQKVKQ